MISENHNNDQSGQISQDLEQLDEIKRTSILNNLSHGLSETSLTYLSENDLITLELFRHDADQSFIYDLEKIESELKTSNPDDAWRGFLGRRLGGLVIILYMKESQKAKTVFKTFKSLGLKGVYLWDCNFGVPNIKTPTDRNKIEKELKAIYSKTHSASFGLTEFESIVERSKSAPPIPTGYKKLDELLDGGLHTGLYILGAETSLGKTTLSLNIAENISTTGRSVLYFSIEMNKFELTGRLLSRETYVLAQAARERGHAQTERTLTTGTKLDKLSDIDKTLIENAKTLFIAKAKNLYLFENIGEMYVDTVRNAVIDFLDQTGMTQPPVVIIDYLQILRHRDKYIDGNDKMKLDKNLFELKKLSNEYSLPIIAVSSLNRDSYKKPKRLTMTAFKESGAIEFTADVLIGMQLEKVAKFGTLSLEQTSAETQKDIRDVDLIILKNRHGKRDTHTHFKYHTWFNDFKEVSGFDAYPIISQQDKKSSEENDDFFDDADDIDDEIGGLFS